MGKAAIVGAELTMEDDSVLPVLVKTRTGYQNLCRLLTRAKLRAAKNESRITWQEMEEFAEGLIALTGDEEGPCNDFFRSRRSMQAPGELVRRASDAALWKGKCHRRTAAASRARRNTARATAHGTRGTAPAPAHREQRRVSCHPRAAHAAGCLHLPAAPHARSMRRACCWRQTHSVISRAPRRCVKLFADVPHAVENTLRRDGAHRVHAGESRLRVSRASGACRARSGFVSARESLRRREVALRERITSVGAGNSSSMELRTHHASSTSAVTS